MKNFSKILGIIAIVAIVGFLIVGCVVTDPDDDSDIDGDGSSTGTDSSNGNSKTPGNTSENPILITVGYSSSHTINSSGEHWFKFTGTGDPVIFETTGSVVDTNMVIWDSYSGASYGSIYLSCVANDDNSGDGNNALCSFTTTSGKTYWIRITARSSTSGTYTLIVE